MLGIFKHRHLVQRSKQRRWHFGFTLIETMIVIAIVGVIATLAIPNLLGTRNRQIEYTNAQQVMNAFRAARLQAISEKTTVSVTFNPINDAPELASATAVSINTTQVGGNNLVTTAAMAKKPTAMTFGVNALSNAEGVHFDALGLVSGQNAAGNAIAIDPATGFALVSFQNYGVWIQATGAVSICRKPQLSSTHLPACPL